MSVEFSDAMKAQMLADIKCTVEMEDIPSIGTRQPSTMCQGQTGQWLKQGHKEWRWQASTTRGKSLHSLDAPLQAMFATASHLSRQKLAMLKLTSPKIGPLLIPQIISQN